MTDSTSRAATLALGEGLVSVQVEPRIDLPVEYGFRSAKGAEEVSVRGGVPP